MKKIEFVVFDFGNGIFFDVPTQTWVNNQNIVTGYSTRADAESNIQNGIPGEKVGSTYTILTFYRT